MVEKEILVVFEGKQKGAKSLKWETLCPPKLVCMHFTTTSICMNFLSRFYFSTPMDYSPWSKRKFWPFLKAKKGAKSLKWERLHSPKLVCTHFTTTSTCMKFLSRFYFLTPMDYSPWSKRKFWPFLKANKKEPNLQNGRGYTHQNWFACIAQQPLLA